MKYLLLLVLIVVALGLLVLRPHAPEQSAVAAQKAPAQGAATALSAAPDRHQPRALLAEDFEQIDAGTVPLSLRPSTGNWAVRLLDGKKVLQGQPSADKGDGIRAMLAIGDNDWQDYAVSFRFRYSEKPEAIVLRVRCEGGMSDYYNLHLDQEKGLLAAFIRNAWHMVKYEHTLPAANEWHRYSAVCRTRSIEVSIAGNTIIDAPADVAIKGQCELFIVKGTCLIDDLRVAPLDQALPAKADGGEF